MGASLLGEPGGVQSLRAEGPWSWGCRQSQSPVPGLRLPHPVPPTGLTQHLCLQVTEKSYGRRGDQAGCQTRRTRYSSWGRSSEPLTAIHSRVCGLRNTASTHTTAIFWLLRCQVPPSTPWTYPGPPGDRSDLSPSSLWPSLHPPPPPARWAAGEMGWEVGHPGFPHSIRTSPEELKWVWMLATCIWLLLLLGNNGQFRHPGCRGRGGQG